MLNEFDPRAIDWCSYRFMLDTFFELYDVEHGDAKIELLRRLGGRQINEVLSEQGLFGDEEVNRDENRVFDVLEETFYEPNEIWKRRSEFSCQEQREEESGSDFLARLQGLAKRCNFCEDAERVCEQFILGVRSEGLKKRLMVEPPHKLTKAILLEISSLWESTPRDYDYDFSQLEYAVRKLCRRSVGRATAKSTIKQAKVRDSLAATTTSAPCEEKDPEDARGAGTITPVMGLVETGTSGGKLRKRIKSEIPTEKLGRKKKKSVSKKEIEESAREDLHSAASVLVPVESSLAAATTCSVPKRKGRPPSTAFVLGGKRYKCNHCDYMSDVRRSILRHERIHTGDRPYQCRFCELRFREKHHLQNHERVHTGETPYICEHCGRGFSKSSTLTDHVRTHTREAPHLCEFCGRGFIQKSALNTHKLIHTGYRPHSCSLCCRGFTTSNLLKTHMKTHSIESASEKDPVTASTDTPAPVPALEPYPVSLSIANFAHNSGTGGKLEQRSRPWPPNLGGNFSGQSQQNDCVPVIDHPKPSRDTQKHTMNSVPPALGLPNW